MENIEMSKCEVCGEQYDIQTETADIAERVEKNCNVLVRKNGRYDENHKIVYDEYPCDERATEESADSNTRMCERHHQEFATSGEDYDNAEDYYSFL